MIKRKWLPTLLLNEISTHAVDLMRHTSNCGLTTLQTIGAFAEGVFCMSGRDVKIRVADVHVVEFIQS